ncbi:hypothetical protein [Aeromicrobium sp.]|uniref:hypothetical protein n=1 Tax=Aeromicrobium sp. TaxID=1871063 RepID=UPI0019B51867|nr:hypothetical protein [Aeromicrobium sp.]MBC7631499.1 DUF3052 family protein [Aeromicrobium sp.]
MIETTNAEKLRITDGFVIWTIGRTAEETGLLDPLPEGAEAIEERDEDRPERVDAALLFVGSRAELVDDLDEVMPQLGSIPIVWISYPQSHVDLNEDTIQDLIGDFGWSAVESIALDETWAAMRIRQS